MNRPSNLAHPVAKFNWRRTLAFIVVALLLIGAWLAGLASEALITITRGSFTLFEPTNTYMVVATFAMLLGVVLLSIQVASILEHVIKGKHE